MEIHKRVKTSNGKKYIRKSVDRNLSRSFNIGQINMYEKGSYNGFVIEKFVAYNDKFDKQLKKIFESTSHEDHNTSFQNRTSNYKEKMSKIYSENSHLIKKKPDFTTQECDTQRPTTKKRRQSLIKVPSKTTKPLSKEKDFIKNHLYFPVLSTTKNELRKKFFNFK